MIQYFPIVTGSLTVLGNINVSGSITTSGSITISGSITSASFASTASFIENAQSASYVLTAQTASFVANAQTASYVLNAVSSSFASTASFVALAQSASNAVSAATASFANTLTVAGNLTAQTLVVQTITSSVDFVTGSTRFGTIAANTHVFTGSVLTSGSIGIGTSSPTKALEILSNTSQDGIKISGTSNPRLTIIDTTNNVQFDALTTDTEAVLRTDTNHPLHLSTNGTVRLTIAASGSATFSGSVRATSPNITAPSLGSGQGAFFASAANGLYGLYIGTSNDTGNSFIQNTRNDGTATAYALSIQPSGGNVLIGTTTDGGQKLQVNGSLYAASVISSGTSIAASTYVSAPFGFYTTSANNAIPFTTWTTLTTVEGNTMAMYLVVIGLAAGGLTDWSATGILYSNGTTASWIVGPTNGSLVQLRISGTAIQVYQNGGSPSQTLYYKLLKIA
jgi:hypothetical protein